MAIGAFVSWNTYQLYEGFAHRADWLYWDPAAHALYGVRIAEAVRHAQLLDLLRTLNEQVLWPPLHSLLQLPFQLALGPGFYASAVCSFFALALVFPALTFLYHSHDDSWFGWAVLMAFAGASPAYAGFGSMPMLEIFGAALTVYSAALYLNKSRWFPLSLTLLFFLKYNYCIYLLMPVAVMELWPRAKGWFAPKNRRIPKLSFFGWFIAASLALMALLLITGGFRIGKLSVRGIGNPLYVLFVIVLIRAALKGQIREGWQRIRGTGREWFTVPVVIWLLIPVPNRVRTLVTFAINAPLGGHRPTEVSYYTYYFHALSGYFSGSWPELLCAAGALAAVLIFRRKNEVVFLFLLFGLPFLLMTLNQNKEERYLFTFVFALWMLCALAVGRLPNIALRAAATLVVCAGCWFYYDISSTHDLVAWPFVPLEVEAPVNYIAAKAAGQREVRILGALNEMSPALLAYHIPRGPHLAWKLEKDPPPGTRIFTVNGDVPGPALETTTFPGGYRVTMSEIPQVQDSR